MKKSKIQRFSEYISLMVEDLVKRDRLYGIIPGVANAAAQQKWVDEFQRLNPNLKYPEFNNKKDDPKNPNPETTP